MPSGKHPEFHGREGDSVQAGQSSALRWVALAVLLAGGFLPPLDFFIVNVALPSIQET